VADINPEGIKNRNECFIVENYNQFIDIITF